MITMLQSCYLCLGLFFQMQWITFIKGNSSSLDIFGLPSVTDHFEDKYYVNRFDNKSFICPATGNPSPNIFWFLNGEKLMNSAATRLNGNLLDLTVADRLFGTYQCRASNPKGTSVSRQFSLSKPVLGAFPYNGDLKHIEAKQYQYLSLPCTNRPACSPVEKCKFEWKVGPGVKQGIKETKGIFVDDEGTLHFLYLDMTDNHKNFTCGIFNKEGQSFVRSTESYRLAVYAWNSNPIEPKLVYNNNVQGRIGENVLLHCAFSGYPLPNITWFNTSGSLILDDGDSYHITEYGRTLEILSLTQDHEGQYNCSVYQAETNSAAHGTIYLNVTGPPKFSPGAMVDQVGVIGSHAVFDCSSSSLPNELPPDTPEWHQNGQDISQQERFTTTGVHLILQSLQKNDTSNIQCRVRNSEGYSFREARLVVIEPIEVNTEWPDMLNLIPDEDYQLRVNASTDPLLSLTYHWSFKNVDNIQEIPRGVNLSDNNQTLTFSPTEENILKMVGFYSVTIFHEYESVQQKMSVSTFVPEKPEGTTSSEDKTTDFLSLTTTQILTTSVTTSIPPPKYGLEENDEKGSSLIAIVIPLVIVILIICLILIGIKCYRNRRKGKMVINKPIMMNEKPVAVLSENTEENVESE